MLGRTFTLGNLINTAISDCLDYGNGESEDENGLDLTVRADWVDHSESEDIIEVTIYQAGVIKLVYRDPETICKKF